MSNESKQQEAQGAREEANTYGKLGVAATLGWAAVEMLPFALDSLVEGKHANKNLQRIGFVAATVAVGAGLYALYKHTHADQLQEQANKEKHSWLDRIRHREPPQDLQR